jgi:hypothetical protein
MIAKHINHNKRKLSNEMNSQFRLLFEHPWHLLLMSGWAFGIFSLMSALSVETLCTAMPDACDSDEAFVELRIQQRSLEQTI